MRLVYTNSGASRCIIVVLFMFVLLRLFATGSQSFTEQNESTLHDLSTQQGAASKKELPPVRSRGASECLMVTYNSLFHSSSQPSPIYVAIPAAKTINDYLLPLSLSLASTAAATVGHFRRSFQFGQAILLQPPAQGQFDPKQGYPRQDQPHDNIGLCISHTLLQ